MYCLHATGTSFPPSMRANATNPTTRDFSQKTRGLGAGSATRDLSADCMWRYAPCLDRRPAAGRLWSIASCQNIRRPATWSLPRPGQARRRIAASPSRQKKNRLHSWTPPRAHATMCGGTLGKSRTGAGLTATIRDTRYSRGWEYPRTSTGQSPTVWATVILPHHHHRHRHHQQQQQRRLLRTQAPVHRHRHLHSNRRRTA